MCSWLAPMPAVPRPCRLHKGLATGYAGVVLDPVMSLHVDGQMLGLHELFGTESAVELLDAFVQPLVNVPDLGQGKPFVTSLPSALKWSLSCMTHHVSL